VTLSIIIPTHNRADQLDRTLRALGALKGEIDHEVIVVDNNSTDRTKGVAESHDPVRYVFEPSTAFSKARRTGAENAVGSYLLFIDDDVLVAPGSLDAIVRTFENDPTCAIVAAQILPEFLETPPDWAIACQRTFNGWSLYNSDMNPDLGAGVQNVEWAAGPMMAVRRDVFFDVHGFPADTVGVETNMGARNFRKLYVGPGDSGLSYLVRQKGFTVVYQPKAYCHHVIPPTRCTVSFWRSRMIGEAHQRAVSESVFYRLSRIARWEMTMKASYRQMKWKRKFAQRLQLLEAFLIDSNFGGMLHEELWVQFYKSYFEIKAVLRRYPDLAGLLWKIGTEGVKNEEYDDVVGSLPVEFLDITDSERYYNSCSITTLEQYRRFLEGDKEKK